VDKLPTAGNNRGKPPTAEILQSTQPEGVFPPRAGRNFFWAAQLFLPTVNWITFARENPAHGCLYRAAQADFNVRGWQGRWRYTAPDGLVLFGGP
jgi:hypothetical protein